MPFTKMQHSHCLQIAASWNLWKIKFQLQLTFPKHRVIEKPFISPNPDSHLTSPLPGHHLFKGSSLAKATEGIQSLTFLCSSNHGTHQLQSQMRRAITQHSRQLAGCSSVKYTLKLVWFQGRYLCCMGKRAIFMLFPTTYCRGIGERREKKGAHQQVLEVWVIKDLPGCLSVVFSISHRPPMSLRQAVYAEFNRGLQEGLDRVGWLWFLSFWASQAFVRRIHQRPTWVLKASSQSNFFLGVFETTKMERSDW